MKRKINRSVMDALGGEEMFNAAVERYVTALEEHAKTENQPAPAANPIIEDLVNNYDGYEVEENTKLQLKRTIEDQVIEDYKQLLADMEILKQQMADMGAAVYESRQMAGFANGEVRRLGGIVADLEMRMSQLESSYPPTT